MSLVFATQHKASMENMRAKVVWVHVVSLLVCTFEEKKIVKFNEMSDIQNRFLNVFLCLVKVRNPLNTTFLAKSIGKMHFYKYIYTSKSNYFLTNLLVKRLQKLSPSLEMPKQFILNLSRENIFHTFLERADNSLKRSLNYLTRNSLPSFVYVGLIFVFCLV